MKPNSKPEQTIQIPMHWTPKQADAVFEFLALLETAIWDAYDNVLAEIAQQDITAAQTKESDHAQDFDDSDLPF